MSLPASLDAERGLIGIILNHNAALFEVSQIVVSSDFFEPLNGELFTLCRDLIEANRTVTAASLMHDAQNGPIWGETKASDYLHQLERDAPPQGLAAGFARTIRDTALRRRIHSLGQELQNVAINSPMSEPAEVLRMKADEAMSALFSSVSDIGLRKLDAINDTILDRLKRSGDQPVGLRLPLAQMQDLTGALVPGRVYVIPGSPGSGKSSLALQIASWVADQGVVAMFSLEMADEEQAERELSAITGIKVERIERALVDNPEYERLWEANEGMRKKGLYIDASARLTASMIRGRSLRLKKTVGLDLIIIDHIHYVARPDPRMQEFDAIDHNLMMLKSFAKEQGVPILILSQLSSEALRDMAKWPHRRPTQGDMLYGGIIDRHADVILMVQRREAFLRRNEPPQSDDRRHTEWQGAVDVETGKAELILVKRRGGVGFGRREVGWDGDRVRFLDNPSRIIREPGEGFFGGWGGPD